MLGFWKGILTVLILYTIAIDGNRARRRRRQAPMSNPAANSINQPPLGPNPQILNAPGQFSSQQGPQNDFGTAKQGGRQYYSPYQGQYGYGSVQGLNYPYAGAGVGSYQYGTGQYGQYGQGMGGQGMGYGSYYNQYPGSNSFYSGYGSSSYNRPGYGSSNYYPSSGGNSYGGYFWNAGEKQNINMFTVFFSSLLTVIICFITV